MSITLLTPEDLTPLQSQIDILSGQLADALRQGVSWYGGFKQTRNIAANEPDIWSVVKACSAKVLNQKLP